MTADEVVASRQATHGDFSRTAAVAQQIKDALRWGADERWHEMPPALREALETMATKMARTVCGDWRHMDHAVDLGGYARLAEKAVWQVATETAAKGEVESL